MKQRQAPLPTGRSPVPCSTHTSQRREKGNSRALSTYCEPDTPLGVPLSLLCSRPTILQARCYQPHIAKEGTDFEKSRRAFPLSLSFLGVEPGRGGGGRGGVGGREGQTWVCLVLNPGSQHRTAPFRWRHKRVRGVVGP